MVTAIEICQPITEECFKNTISPLIKLKRESYSSPNNAINLIASLVKLKNYSNDLALDTLFKNTVNQLTQNLVQSCENNLKQRLNQAYQDLNEAHDWKDELGILIGINRNPNSSISIDLNDSEHEENRKESKKSRREKTTTASARNDDNNINRFFANINSRQRVRVESSEEEVDNEIYKAILHKNIIRLKRLLSISNSTEENLLHYNNSFSRPATIQSNSRVDQPRTDASSLVHQFIDEITGTRLINLIKETNYKYFKVLLAACSQKERFKLAIDAQLHPLIIYLSLPDLNVLLHELIKQPSTRPYDFEFYRSHRALLAICRALIIRIHSEDNLDNKNKILELAKKLLKRGLEFHNYHINAKSSLLKLESKLKNPLLLIDDDNEQDEILEEEPKEETIEYSLSSRHSGSIQSINTHHSTQQSIPASVKTKNTVSPGKRNHDKIDAFFNSSPLSIQKMSLDNTKVNMEYCYDDDDIHFILNARIEELKQLGKLKIHDEIVVLASATLNSTAANNQISDVINSYINQSDSNKIKIMLIPVHIGEHWIGIHFILESKEITEVTLFNCKRNPAYYSLKESISSELVKTGLIRKELEINSFENETLQKDHDFSSCGLLLIENICNHLRKLRISSMDNSHTLNDSTLEMFRKKHF